MLIDISPEITEKLAVFPGDIPFSLKSTVELGENSIVKVSSLHSTLHIGAHTDAPSHYDAHGKDIANVNLEDYIGSCQVIHVPHRRRIRSKDFDMESIHTQRVLFRTDSFDPHQWQDDFAYFDPDLIHSLYKKKVRLVGIDTPSIDFATSKTLEAHQAVNAANMRILEGISLTDVTPGCYELIAIPLRIKGGDASPVRAVLRTP